MANIILLPLVHEKQSMQLCALHTVNNLLQLSSVVDDSKGTTLNDISEINTDKNGNMLNTNYEAKGDESVVDTSHHCIYRLNINVMQPFTKSMFDDIADTLILAESELLSLPSIDSPSSLSKTHTSKENKTKISFLEAARSSHRAPVVRNYSYEVIEKALQLRGVKLTWYNVTDEMPPTSSLETSCKNVERKEMNPKKGDVVEKEVVIGFIINIKMDKKNFLSSPMSYIPLVGNIISPKDSHHWLTVTKIRRVWDESNTESSNNPSPKFVHDNNYSSIVQGYCTNRWHVIDSKAKKISINSEENLMNYLMQIKEGGGKIFRATTNVFK